MESNRQRKISQIIQEEFAEYFRKQAAGAGRNLLITVAGVRITPDLGIAKIYLSIFPNDIRDAVMKEIDQNKPAYRNFLGQQMGKQLRIIPQLNFYLDTSLDNAERVEKELKGLGDNPVL